MLVNSGVLMTDRTVAPSPSELSAMLESRSADFACADEFLDLMSELGFAVSKSDEARASIGVTLRSRAQARR